MSMELALGTQKARPLSRLQGVAPCGRESAELALDKPCDGTTGLFSQIAVSGLHENANDGLRTGRTDENAPFVAKFGVGALDCLTDGLSDLLRRDADVLLALE